MTESQRLERRGYLVAVLTSAAAWLLRWSLDPLFVDHLPFITFFPAIVVTAWVGGLRPALVAAALSFLLALYFFIPPRFAFAALTGAHAVGFVLYVVCSLGIAVVGGNLHHARRLAQQRGETLRITLASIGDAVITTDAAGVVTYLNAVAEGLTGWPRADAVGRPLAEVFRILNEDTRRPVENPVEKVLKLGKVVGLANHTVLVSRDGTERPIDDSAAPIRDDRGAILGVILVFHDITERKKAESLLAAQAHQLRVVTDTAPVLLVQCDAAGRFTFVNRPYSERFGLAPEEVVGKHIRDVVGEAAYAVFAHHVEAALAGHPVEFETEIPYAEIGPQYIRAAYTPERDAAGRVVGLVAAITNVTARKKAELALAASEATLRAFYDHAPLFMGVVEPTGDGDILHLYDNPLSCRFFGLPAGATANRRVLADLDGDPALVAEWLARYAESAAAGGPVRFEFANGPRWLAATVCPVGAGPTGRPRFCYIAEDVTDRRRAVEALREADRRKDDFLALLAHELRNPLAPLRYGLELMALTTDSPAAIEESRGMMERQVVQLVRIVDDLLDVSRISRGKLELRRERVPLRAVVEQAVETTRPLFLENDQRLDVELPPDPVPLDVDPTRVTQVFANLLNNAAKFTPPGGRIRLRVDRDGEAVVVRVADPGVGIPREALGRIFDMFSQVDRPTEKGQGGLGIGLALVKGLVEMHGGSVVADSAGEKMGSVFTVRLPVAGGPLPVDAPVAPRRAAGGPRRRVLVVDDNEDSARSLALLLEATGSEVRTAADGLQGVAAAEAFRPDVIFMDVGMPRLNGLEATRRIRQQPWGRGIVVLALTGWGQKGDREKTAAAGCDGHLVKPVEPVALEQILANLPPRPA